METLAYLHLALTYEDCQEGSKTAFGVDRGSTPSRNSQSGRYGLLAVGTVIGLLGTTSNALALLQHGDRNPQVTRVQKRLQELDFFSEEPTGYFGEITVDAVKQFQRDRELDADGIVGSETETALFENPKARSNGPFNTDSFLASPESQPSSASSPSQPTSEERDATISPVLPTPRISSSQPESSFTSEDESFLSETLVEPAPAETAEVQTPSESEEGEPLSVAEQSIARAQLLKVGTRGESVKQLQEKLQDAGFAPGEIDGIYGQQTKKAVIAFQRSRGLFVDGIAGQQTLSALKIGSSSAPSQRLYTVKVRNS